MDKKEKVDVKKNDNRSELVGKVKTKEGTKKVSSAKKESSTKKEKKVNLEETIALDTVEIMRKGNAKKHTEEEKEVIYLVSFLVKRKVLRKRLVVELLEQI